VQARLGKVPGNNALIEFVSTFEDGMFNFQEKELGKATSGRLPRLDESYSVQKPLERCLLDAALAQDQLAFARRLLPSTDVLIIPVEGKDFEDRWQNMLNLPEPPYPEELNLMIALTRLADRQTTLTQMFQAMDQVPTWELWRAAALLVSHELVEVRLPNQGKLQTTSV